MRNIRNYECVIYDEDKNPIYITADSKTEGFVKTIAANPMSPDMISAVTVIQGVIQCLVTGRPIPITYNPAITEDEETHVLCRWTRAGFLELIKNPTDPVNKKVKHALTLNEAMKRRGIFTCTRALYKRLPAIRSSVK